MRFLDSPAHQRNNPVVVVAFGDVIEGPVLDGRYPVSNGAVGGEHDNFGGGVRLLYLGGEGDSVFVGQFHIAQNHMHLFAFQHFQPGSSVFGFQYGVAFEAQNPGQQTAEPGFIIDNQEGSRQRRQTLIGL